MKTRNAFATAMICVLSALTIADFVSPQKVEAKPIRDCHRVVTGTYLTTIFASLGTFRGILTFNADGNFVATASSQSGIPNIPPFSNSQGRWRCISDREITATGLRFNYPTATLPGSITRTDFRATFNPENGTMRETVTQRTYALDANPLEDDAPVSPTFTVTGQRIKPEHGMWK